MSPWIKATAQWLYKNCMHLLRMHICWKLFVNPFQIACGYNGWYMWLLVQLLNRTSSPSAITCSGEEGHGTEPVTLSFFFSWGGLPEPTQFYRGLLKASGGRKGKVVTTDLMRGNKQKVLFFHIKHIQKSLRGISLNHTLILSGWLLGECC